MLTRSCPECGNEIQYLTKKSLCIAATRCTKCKSCVGKSQRTHENLVRNCPTCKKEVSHKTTKRRNFADKRKIECRSCTVKRISPTRGKPRSAETREKCRLHNLGKRRSEATKQKCSESRAKGIANGTIKMFHGFANRTWHLSTKTGEEELADSKLELFYMMLLDTDDTVYSWTKCHGIRIPYEIDGRVRNYVPDFLVTLHSGTTRLDEVKGYENPTSESKHLALSKYVDNNGMTCLWITTLELAAVGYHKWLKESKS